MTGNFTHIPVLASETVSLLAVRDGIFYDGTAGMGGHSQLMLESRPGISIIATDIDPEMAEKAKQALNRFPGRAKVFCGSYAEAKKFLDECGIKSLAGALLDLGVSSLHYDKASRGFAFKNDGPLDMRLNPAFRLTAEELVNDWPINQLEAILRSCGEHNSRRITHAIEKARTSQRISSTSQLADIICSVIPSRPGHVHPATKTFMALRIAVNREFENIRNGVRGIAALIETGGRFAIITFHSAEDRLVKKLFNDLLSEGEWKKITGKAVKPSEEEIAANPRSRSAQLRVIEKI